MEGFGCSFPLGIEERSREYSIVFDLEGDLGILVDIIV